MSGFVNQWLPALRVKPVDVAKCLLVARYGLSFRTVRFGHEIESIPGLTMQLEFRGQRVFPKPVALSALARDGNEPQIIAMVRGEGVAVWLFNNTTMHVVAVPFARVRTDKPTLGTPFEVVL
jgi:hypothetical protein